MRRLERRLMVGLLGPVVAIVSIASPVRADETAAGEAPAAPTRSEIGVEWASTSVEGLWALPLEYLGYGPALVATAAEPSVTLPVPPVAGMAPRRFETVVELADHVEGAEVRVVATGETLNSLMLAAGERQDLVVELPLGTAELTLLVTPTEGGTCPVPDRADLARFRDGAVWYEGRPAAPSSLADVLPVAVGVTRFVVPAESSPGIDAAVLDLTSRLAARYPGAQQVEVRAETEPVGPLGPFGLTVVVDESPQAGVSLVDGALVLSGTGTELTAQLAAVDGDVLALADTDRVVLTGDAVSPSEDHRGRRVPFGDVPGAVLAANGARHLEVGAELSQASFGGSVDSYRLRLGGLATPPPGHGDDVQLALRIDGELIDVIPVAENGRFDTQFNIAGEQVGATNFVQLTLDGVEACESATRFAVQIDRGSWVEASPGDGALGGFARFPQAGRGTVAVFPGRGLSQLTAAAELVAMLQEATPNRLVVEVVDRSEAAITDRPLLAVGADVELLGQLDAPLQGEAGYLDTTGTQLRAADGLGEHVTLQAFASAEGVDVVAVDLAEGSDDPGLPATFVAAGWSALGGHLVQLDDSGRPTVLDLGPPTTDRAAELAPLADIATDSGPSPRRHFLDGLGIALAMSLAMMVAFRLVRRYRPA